MNHISLSAAYSKASRLCHNHVLPEQQPEEVQQLLQVLHQLAEQLQQQCGPRELANIIYSCSRLRNALTAKQLLTELLQDGKLQQANPQDVSGTLRTVCKLGIWLTHMELQQLAQQLMRVLPQAKPRDVATSLHALADVGEQLAHGDLQQMVRHILQMQPDIRPSDSANILRALASMEHTPDLL
jgi:hypothetical protein